MLENSINYLFNEVSLYTKEKFNVFELKMENMSIIKMVFLNFYTILECNKKS